MLTKSNFDGLLIPLNHPSRSLSDTYYLDKNTVLRTHTSAHQIELLKSGAREFIACGDCYRKDEIDRNHYPVFHQIEGIRIIDDAVSCWHYGSFVFPLLLYCCGQVLTRMLPCAAV